MNQPPDLILLGVMQALKERGFLLSIRDYLDALRALELGFGCGGREDLQKLVVALWARSDEEERLIRRTFAGVPSPTPEELQFFELGTSRVQSNDATEGTGTSSSPTDSQPAQQSETMPLDPKALMEFDRHDATSGIPLPPAGRAPVGHDSFILEPQTVISHRRLAVIWRRFRKMSPSGPRMELDVGACISEQCRMGALSRIGMTRIKNGRSSSSRATT
jgi:hypothetical protein